MTTLKSHTLYKLDEKKFFVDPDGTIIFPWDSELSYNRIYSDADKIEKIGSVYIDPDKRDMIPDDYMTYDYEHEYIITDDIDEDMICPVDIDNFIDVFITTDDFKEYHDSHNMSTINIDPYGVDITVDSDFLENSGYLDDCFNDWVQSIRSGNVWDIMDYSDIETWINENCTINDIILNPNGLKVVDTQKASKIYDLVIKSLTDGSDKNDTVQKITELL